MSEMSVFSLSKLSALTAQIKRDLGAYYVSVYNFNSSFSVNISFEEFDKELQKINEHVDKIVTYFGLDKDRCTIEIESSIYRPSIKIVDLQTKIEITIGKA